MAVLTLNREKLRTNYQVLTRLFEERGVDWGVVSKMLCGNKLFLQELINLGITEVHDSRISNLAMVKRIKREVQTVYIKPVSKKNVGKMVEFADVSLNSELETIRMISAESVLQGKNHKIIIMVETGDLREGVMGEQLIDFYEEVFQLPGIEVIGLGTNLNCLNGVMPSTDKLIQLSLYKQIIELKFGHEIPWLSAGTSVTIPLMLSHQLPQGINHFRVGETLYFGVDLVKEEIIEGMHGDVFELHAEIIELQEKPLLPTGVLGSNPRGEIAQIDESLYGKTSFRAILDVGLLDVSPEYLFPKDPELEILGASSDMLIVNLGIDQKGLKVGETLTFNLKYMGALGLLNSDYVEKIVV
ncbi:alanine/ornithine racemase family PLP-dependent enzyme [Algoriphagus aestuariicola]|uniref:Alanine/ornithine racemase family PLP-dependent enzyme n=1 Tax=Algoriphagus aestuariicola TaxID=1852016 RepID=A0ABS3BWA0_9BACT|nr:alanine/ornithine racemase family PLP-dependent enzyme [Algoriphagus aestuariicola]MBN7803516.1 alanine/ornithine racemase family PLP-dependent enzyme [Algoriphagus aestuariicola]